MRSRFFQNECVEFPQMVWFGVFTLIVFFYVFYTNSIWCSHRSLNEYNFPYLFVLIYQSAQFFKMCGNTFTPSEVIDYTPRLLKRQT